MTDQKLKNIIAYNLTTAMYERKWNITTLHNHSGVSTRTIRKILDGQNTTNIKTINKLVNALKIQPYTLLKPPVKVGEVEDMKKMIEYFDSIAAHAIECKKYWAKQVHDTSENAVEV